MTLYLLTTPRPLYNTTTYICGIFLTYTSLGLAVYFGLDSLLKPLLQQVLSPHPFLYLIEAIAGVLLLSYSWQKRHTRPPLIHAPTVKQQSHTFQLGVTVTCIEFATAAPYLGSIALVSEAHLNPVYGIILLMIYNLIFISIPLFLVALFSFKQQVIKPHLDAMVTQFSGVLHKLMIIVFAVLGGIFLGDAVISYRDIYLLF